MDSINGKQATELEKMGATSRKFMNMLAERPLDVIVQRGLPLHVISLPASTWTP